MGGDEEEIMQKIEQYILMQKIENLQYNCLTMIEKSIKGTWAFNFWTNTFDKLDKNYNLIKNREGKHDN
jgi:pantothenate kinase